MEGIAAEFISVRVNFSGCPIAVIGKLLKCSFQIVRGERRMLLNKAGGQRPDLAGRTADHQHIEHVRLGGEHLHGGGVCFKVDPAFYAVHLKHCLSFRYGDGIGSTILTEINP